MKFLNPKIHGFLDYAVVLLLFIAPNLFGFDREASTISYVLGLAYLGMALATAYPLGVFKLIPFPIHGTVELILSPLLIALPWIAGFSYDSSARNFFVIGGAALFLVWLTTDYKAVGNAYKRLKHDLKERGDDLGRRADDLGTRGDDLGPIGRPRGAGA